VQPFDSFTLGHFRGLSGLTLEGLGRINVLVGANNSGKSSILEALELACDPSQMWTWVSVADQRDSRSNAIDRIDNLLWLFPRTPELSQDHQTIDLSFSGSTPFARIEAEANIFLTTYDDDAVAADSTEKPDIWGGLQKTIAAGESLGTRRVVIVKISAIQRTSAFPVLEFLKRFRLMEGQRMIGERQNGHALRTPCASIAPLSHRTRSIHAERLSQAKESGLVGDAVALLQQFDPEIQDLDILARQGTFADLRIRHKTLGLAPLNAFGDGMRRALLYALTLPQVRGGVLLIDEIESAIHVKALGGVFTWLTRACEQFAVQLFASTHSLEALESLLGDDEQSASQVVGYHLPNRSTGNPITRYEGGLLARLLRDRGLDVR